MIRIVLDTNVYVSALLRPKSVPAQILNAWRQHRFELLISLPLYSPNKIRHLSCDFVP